MPSIIFVHAGSVNLYMDRVAFGVVHIYLL